MTPGRALVLCALAVAALALVDRTLSSRAISHGPRIERLVDEARAKELVVAALSLRAPKGGERALYLRSRGLWRLVGPQNAVCDGRAIEGLVGRLLGARAVVRTRDPAERARYGLGAGESPLLELCGPQVLTDPAGDALLALELGATFIAGQSAFVARPGEAAVLEIDVDPRTALSARAAPGFSPLVDPRLVAGPFPGPQAGIERVFLDLSDGSALELARAAPDPEAPGDAPRRWNLLENGLAHDCPPPRAEAFLAFLLTVPYARLDSPKRAAALGFDAPAARLTIIASGGDSMVLEIAPTSPAGRAWARNVSLETLGELDAADVPALEPTAAAFLDLERPNAWDEWLRKRFGAGR